MADILKARAGKNNKVLEDLQAAKARAEQIALKKQQAQQSAAKKQKVASDLSASVAKTETAAQKAPQITGTQMANMLDQTRQRVLAQRAAELTAQQVGSALKDRMEQRRSTPNVLGMRSGQAYQRPQLASANTTAARNEQLALKSPQHFAARTAPDMLSTRSGQAYQAPVHTPDRRERAAAYMASLTPEDIELNHMITDLNGLRVKVDSIDPNTNPMEYTHWATQYNDLLDKIKHFSRTKADEKQQALEDVQNAPVTGGMSISGQIGARYLHNQDVAQAKADAATWEKAGREEKLAFDKGIADPRSAEYDTSNSMQMFSPEALDWKAANSGIDKNYLPWISYSEIRTLNSLSGADQDTYRRMLIEAATYREAGYLLDTVDKNDPVEVAALAVSGGLGNAFGGLVQSWNSKVKGDYTPVLSSANSLATGALSEQLHGVMKGVADVGQALGFMLPTIAVSMVTRNIGGLFAVRGAAGAARLVRGGKGAVDAMKGVQMTSKAGAFGEMYASSSGMSFQQALEQGYKIKDAKAYATINGLLEAGLQSVLGGYRFMGANAWDAAGKALGKIKLGADVTKKLAQVSTAMAAHPATRYLFQTLEAVGAFTTRAGEEFVEEWMQAWLDPAVRNVIFDENNEVKPFSAEALYNGLIGGLTAGLFNIAGVTSDWQGTRMGRIVDITKRVAAVENNRIAEINYALAADEGSVSNALVQDMYQKIISGDAADITEADWVALTLANKSYKPKTKSVGETMRNDERLLTDTLRIGLEAPAGTEAHDKAREVYDKMLRNETITEEEWQALTYIVGQQTRSNIQQARDRVFKQGLSLKPEAKGGEVDQEQAARYGEQGQQVYAALRPDYDEQTLPMTNYDAAFSILYAAGAQGVKLDDALNSIGSLAGRTGAGTITYSEAQQIYEAGRADGLQSRIGEGYKNKVRNANAGFTHNEYSDKVSAETVDMLDQLGKKLGVQILMKEYPPLVGGGIIDGEYDPANAVVYINPEAGHPEWTVVKHEFTHRVRNMSPEAYERYKKGVLNYILKSGRADTYGLKMKNIFQAYVDGKSTHSEDFLIEEFMGDFTRDELFKDPELLMEMVNEHRSVVQKILDIIRDIIAMFKGEWRQGQYNFTQRQLRNMERMFVDALNATEVNIKNAEAVETGTVEEMPAEEKAASLSEKRTEPDDGSRQSITYAESRQAAIDELTAKVEFNNDPHVRALRDRIANGTMEEEDYDEELLKVMEEHPEVLRKYDTWTRLHNRHRAMVAGDEEGVARAFTEKSTEPLMVAFEARLNDITEKLDKMTERTQASTEEILESANVSYDRATESVAPSDARYSLATWDESEYVTGRREAAKEIAAALDVPMSQAEKYIDDINSVAKMIVGDRERLDYVAAKGLSPFVSNVEYGGSFDFSTLCKKRRLFTGTFQAIQDRLGDIALTPFDVLQLRIMMREAGYEVPCGLCYVEGSRTGMGKFSKEFIALYKKYNPDAAWVPTMSDVNTPDGVEAMRNEHPDVYADYEHFWNNHGKLRPEDPNLFASQQKPKLYMARSAYDGEILKYFSKAKKILEKNLNGGIRLQSFSDFEVANMIDVMQVIMDMSRVGLTSQAYTKVPEFARAFGNTGVKINLSLITKGIDENGQLIFDDVEGMPHQTAFGLRNQYSKNVGTILVVFNNEQLKAAMADDRIDFIIPFHRSQWKKDQYAALGLPEGTKDFTDQQTEKWLTPKYHEYRGRQVETKIEDIMSNTYWEFEHDGKWNAEKYLRMCAEDGRRPVFYKLLVDNHDGSYSLQPDGSTDGYWKLLIDFKMYDNDGVGSPQLPVRPEFNMDEITRIMNEYEGGHEHFPVANDIVNKFVNEYEANHTEDTRKSISSAQDAEYLRLAADPVANRDALDKMVREAANEAGYRSPKLYHGTRTYGHTKFDPSMADDGRSIWLTDNKYVAESYSGTLKTGTPGGRGGEMSNGVRVADIATMPIQRVLDMYNELHERDGRPSRILSPEELNNVINAEVRSIRETADKAARILNDNKLLPYLYELLDTPRETRSFVSQYLRWTASLGGANTAEEYRTLDARFAQLAPYPKGFYGIWSTIFDKSDREVFANTLRFVAKNMELDPGATLVWNGDDYNIQYADWIRDQLAEDWEAIADTDKGTRAGNYALYAKYDNPLVIEGEGNNWDEIFFIPPELRSLRRQIKQIEQRVGEANRGEDERWVALTKELDERAEELNARYGLNVGGWNTTRAIVKYAQDHDYDSVIFEDVVDVSEHAWDYFASDVYVVFDSNQVKSADPVTYDKNNKPIPLSERFNENENDIRYSITQDAEYLRLAEDPEANRDALQRMVDEAAERAFVGSKIRTRDGKLRRVYHGTFDKTFTVFDPNLIGTAREGDTGFFGRGFYFAFTEGEARTYGSRVIPAYLNILNPFNFQKELYTLDGNRPHDYNAERAVFLVNFVNKFPELAENHSVLVGKRGDEDTREIPLREFADLYMDVYQNQEFSVEPIEGEYGTEWLVASDKQTESYTDDSGKTHSWTGYGFERRYLYERDARNRLTTAYEYLANRVFDYIELPNPRVVIMETDFASALKERKHDGVIQSEDGDEIVAFYPNQIKSADPVTYDDNGNPIPLSERFNTEEDDIRYSLTPVEPVQPTSNKWVRSATFAEVKAKHPTLFDLAADESEKRNPTQVKVTVSTYRKIYNILADEGFDGTILDASSGLGLGTQVGRDEFGYNVEDIEPYPDKSYKPMYTDYSTLDKKYDVIISNAVLNVIPQDLRDDLTVKMGQMLNPGGRIFVNVRGDDVLKAGSKVAVDAENMEYFIESKGSYQKGFTRPELKAYLEDALGDGFTVEPTSKFGKVSAIVTKVAEVPEQEIGTARFSITPNKSITAAQDEEYLRLAKDPEANRDALQRMVDEAAKAAGYTFRGFHGTPYGNFKIFRSGERIVLTDNKDIADGYADKYGSDFEGKDTLNLYADDSTGGIITLDMKGMVASRIPRTAIKGLSTFMRGKAKYKPNLLTMQYLRPDEADTNAVVDFFAHKYGDQLKAVKFLNIIDPARNQELYGEGEMEYAGTVLFELSNNRVKSADPVTYDDEGNVIPLSERFNRENPDRRYSLSQIPEELENIAEGPRSPEEMISLAMPKEKQGVKVGIAKNWHTFQRLVVDAGETVHRISEALDDPSLYTYYNNVHAAQRRAEKMMELYAADVKGQRTGKSLNAIFDPIRAKGEDYYRDFQLYLYHQHNMDLMSREDPEKAAAAKDNYNAFLDSYPAFQRMTQQEIDDIAWDNEHPLQTLAKEYNALASRWNYYKNLHNKPVFGVEVTAEESAKEVSRLQGEHEEFRDLARDVYGYVKNLQQYRVSSGLISQMSVDHLNKLYPHYVPTYLLDEAGVTTGPQDAVTISSTIKEKSGNFKEVKLMPLHVALANQTRTVTRNGAMNLFGQRLLGAYQQLKTELNMPLPKELEKKRQGRDKVRGDIVRVSELYNSFNPEREETINEIPDAINVTGAAKSNSFTVRIGDAAYEMVVSPELFTAIKALSPSENANERAVLSWLAKANNVFKALCTGYNPIFTAKNFIRDLQDVLFYSRDLSAFARNYPRAWSEIAKGGKYWETYQSLGGLWSSFYDYQSGELNKGNKLRRWTLGRIETLNEWVEQAPRLAEFMSAVDKVGGIEKATMDQLMDAMYAAADVTVNFGRKGTATWVNTYAIPFFNPAVQGFSKFVRRFTETKGAKGWANLICKAALFGIMPSLINQLLYADDDDWDELSDSDKNLCYCFKIGKDLWIKIPKGRALSLFGLGVNAGATAASGEDVDWWDYVKTGMEQVGPTNPATSNIFYNLTSSKIFDKDNPGTTWYGSDIESQRMQNYAPEERYDAKTDSISKWLGKTLGLSPKKINYIIDQYSGIIGDVVLPLLTPAAERNALAKAFTIDSNRQNKLSGEFYDLKDELTYNNSKTGADETDALMVRWINKQAEGVNEVNAEIRKIEEDTSMSGKEKSDALDIQYGIRNELIRQALDTSGQWQNAMETAWQRAQTEITEDDIDTEDLTAEDIKDKLNNMRQDYAFREATREVYGAEVALEMWDKSIYNKATEIKDVVNYDDFYEVYTDYSLRKYHDEGSPYMAIVDYGMSDAEATAMLSQMMPESQYERVALGAGQGMSTISYIRFQDIKKNFDYDGNNSYKQGEIEDALRSLMRGGGGLNFSAFGGQTFNSGISTTDAAILWQISNSGWKWYNNPFSQGISHKIYDALHADNTATSFGNGLDFSAFGASGNTTQTTSANNSNSGLDFSAFNF